MSNISEIEKTQAELQEWLERAEHKLEQMREHRLTHEEIILEL